MVYLGSARLQMTYWKAKQYGRNISPAPKRRRQNTYHGWWWCLLRELSSLRAVPDLIAQGLDVYDSVCFAKLMECSAGLIEHLQGLLALSSERQDLGELDAHISDPDGVPNFS